MSTTFGVIIPGISEPIKVAGRYGAGLNKGVIINWRNPLAPLLPRETKVIPLDNSAQGVETIGDLIDLFNQQE